MGGRAESAEYSNGLIIKKDESALEEEEDDVLKRKRKGSCDSLCSVGSTASFAFVPVDSYKIGRAVKPRASSEDHQQQQQQQENSSSNNNSIKGTVHT